MIDTDSRWVARRERARRWIEAGSDLRGEPAACVSHGGGTDMASKLIMSTLTCPACRSQSTHTMPTDGCMIVAECHSCGHTMLPKPGDCCVFCSFGDVACPPIQWRDCAGADGGKG
jgi:Zn ribbon nucleic-acid-binding protein